MPFPSDSFESSITEATNFVYKGELLKLLCINSNILTKMNSWLIHVPFLFILSYSPLEQFLRTSYNLQS